MNTKLLLTGCGFLILVALTGWYLTSSNTQAPAPTVNVVAGQPVAVTHNMSLAKRILTPDITTVTQGDQVTIKVMSDEAGEFHVSGYEIENNMIVGTELSFSFTADKAGRYNFELHPKMEEVEEEHDSNATEETATNEAEEDIVIGAFVVNPR